MTEKKTIQGCKKLKKELTEIIQKTDEVRSKLEKTAYKYKPTVKDMEIVREVLKILK